MGCVLVETLQFRHKTKGSQRRTDCLGKPQPGITETSQTQTNQTWAPFHPYDVLRMPLQHHRDLTNKNWAKRPMQKSKPFQGNGEESWQPLAGLFASIRLLGITSRDEALNVATVSTSLSGGLGWLEVREWETPFTLKDQGFKSQTFWQPLRTPDG